MVACEWRMPRPHANQPITGTEFRSWRGFTEVQQIRNFVQIKLPDCDSVGRAFTRGGEHVEVAPYTMNSWIIRIFLLAICAQKADHHNDPETLRAKPSSRIVGGLANAGRTAAAYRLDAVKVGRWTEVVLYPIPL